MKATIAIVSFFFAIQSLGIAQNSQLEKLWHNLATSQPDSTRVLILNDISDHYKLAKPDSAIYYGNQALMLAGKIGFPKGEVIALHLIILANSAIGNDAKALEAALRAIKIAEKNNLTLEKVGAYHLLGRIYTQSHNYEEALRLFKQSIMIYDSLNHYHYSGIVRNDLGELYLSMGKLDSAQIHSQKSYELGLQYKNRKVQYYSLPTLGKIQHVKGNNSLALFYYLKGLKLDVKNYLYYNPNLAIAKIYQQMGQPDSSIFFAKQSLEIGLENGFYSSIIDASIFLSGIYEKNDLEKSLAYSKMAIAYHDSLLNLGKATAFQTTFELDEQMRQKELEDAKIESQNRIRMNAFLGSTFTLLVIGFFLYRNSRIKQKAKQNIEKAYSQLKATQSQLIQSEKMASLGELTAGIAHEIQNPLNFVNNFSEVNEELLAEMKDELRKGKIDDALALADNVLENQKKINHHGKRADGIVKGMLQHSRSSSGVKEPTNINVLADEYLRLAHHGFRAKDKSFNAKFETDFDPKVEAINVVPQEIGRVILNLINNAFYAVTEKKKSLDLSGFKNLSGLEGMPAGEAGYEPTVTVTTKKFNDKVLISVKDNGNGIPQKVLDKIFQPFFTTKATGQGTGLGLSLSYDIVKAHGGELTVETREGEGSEFVVSLPV